MDAQLAWDDLAHLLAVARLGSLTAAADALGVHHATVHRRIARLESVLGTRLFDRSPQGYQVTAAGEEAVEHARRIEEEVFGLQRVVGGRDVALTGEVRVTTTDSIMPILGPHLRRFREVNQGIRLSLDLGSRMFDLARREADVAIRPVVRPPDYAVGRRVCGLGWAVYGAEGPWIGLTSELGQLGAARWLEANVPADDVVVRVSTVPGLVDAVRAGLGRALLPCFMAEGLPRLSGVIPEASTGLWLLVHADVRGTARVRAFVDFAWDVLRAEAPRFEG